MTPHDTTLVLGHHYQRPDVLRHCDIIGDSLELSRKAAASDARRILFCGVRFMAESADILTRPDQAVFLSDVRAGCPMADMATLPQATAAWAHLTSAVPAAHWVPVTYVNSSAEIKAFCGQRGGSACTSGNCADILRRSLSRDSAKVFFLPDEHLATNTAHDLGIPDEGIVRYDPALPDGGVTDAQLAAARLVVWKGFCHVHTLFRPEHVAAVRTAHPGAKIVIHPEAPKEVVRLCDAHGSTSQIIDYVNRSPEGATIVIGTEHQLVQRLAEEQRGRRTLLALCSSTCPNMARTTEAAVLDILRRWPEENRIRVPDAIAHDARLCLQRMLG